MQIYISTPINARKEPTFAEKLQAAKQRVEYLKKVILNDERFAAYNHIVHTNFDGSVKSEAVAMGICILSVLVCDAIYMDSGWQSSKGCNLEYHAAKIYGKTIYEHETAKVGPKFKIGDWIINRTDATIMQIVNDKDFYESVEISGQRRTDTYNYLEWDFRLWTIQDAKDGDVLSYRNGQWCFIYKGIVTEDTFKYYALLSEKGITVNDAAFSLLSFCITPATKEQRDTLMKVMADAGYTFDFEKKELKKIEQKPAWSGEDEVIVKDIIDKLWRLSMTSVGDEAKVCKCEIEWLESLRSQNKKEWDKAELLRKAKED